MKYSYHNRLMSLFNNSTLYVIIGSVSSHFLMACAFLVLWMPASFIMHVKHCESYFFDIGSFSIKILQVCSGKQLS